MSGVKIICNKKSVILYYDLQVHALHLVIIFKKKYMRLFVYKKKNL